MNSVMWGILLMLGILAYGMFLISVGVRLPRTRRSRLREAVDRIVEHDVRGRDPRGSDHYLPEHMTRKDWDYVQKRYVKRMDEELDKQMSKGRGVAHMDQLRGKHRNAWKSYQDALKEIEQT